jgi:hypothetical protein
MVLAFSIGMTIILLSLVVFPLVIYYRLKTIKGKFGDHVNLKSYGIFYIGINDNAYYWEIIVNTIRKLVLVITAAVVPSTG